MKVLLPIGVYLCLVIILGYVLAYLAPRESLNEEPRDDEF